MTTNKKHITILTGAGISAESGIKTFRDADGLWEGHDVMEVATPQGFEKNPTLVLEFYNQRRRQLLDVQPNAAHTALAALENDFEVTVITQNVDDLHERSGSTHVVHLHGELIKVRSTHNERDIQVWKKDLIVGDMCTSGHQLRPHIVWFGEDVPMMDTAIDVISKTDAVMIIGTSMQVYPAAGLMNYAPIHAPIYFIDPKPTIESTKNIHVFPLTATQGVPMAIDQMSKKLKTN